MAPEVRDASLGVAEEHAQAGESEDIDPSDQTDDRGQRSLASRGTRHKSRNVQSHHGDNCYFLDDIPYVLCDGSISLHNRSLSSGSRKGQSPAIDLEHIIVRIFYQFGILGWEVGAGMYRMAVGICILQCRIGRRLCASRQERSKDILY